jgi:hypothetical protein
MIINPTYWDKGRKNMKKNTLLVQKLGVRALGNLLYQPTLGYWGELKETK